MRLLRLRFILGVLVALLVIGTVSASAATPAEDHDKYLALGDSVVFGFITQAGFEYVNPDNFIGWPTYVGQALRFNTADAGCPGETTGSFLSLSAADTGCRAFRAQFPLHVPYVTTQLDFATAFLRAHPDTRLVTIGLGANDLFLLQAQCGGNQQCLEAGLPQALATIAQNMVTILHSLRAAGFRGVVIVMNYYSLDYTDATSTAITQALNQTLAAAAADQDAAVADVFSAFHTAASNPFAGGRTCMAGLLNALPQNQVLCDVHPSQSGQHLIADTVLRTYREAIRNGD
jgi:lysophospholipase L1-like esterase